jgi:hypothetical protein
MAKLYDSMLVRTKLMRQIVRFLVEMSGHSVLLKQRFIGTLFSPNKHEAFLQSV